MRSLILLCLFLTIVGLSYTMWVRAMRRRIEGPRDRDEWSEVLRAALRPQLALFTAVAVVAVLLVGRCWREVGPAQTMAIYDPLRGGIQLHDYREGWHLVPPWASAKVFSKRLQEYTMSALPNEGATLGDDSMSCQTKEGLAIKIDATAAFRIPAGGAHRLWKAVGSNYVRVVVRPATRNVVRLVVAKYGIMEVYSNAPVDMGDQPGVDFYVGRRHDVEQQITELLEKQFEEKGLQLVMFLLRNVSIEAPAFEKAIVEKQVAQQGIVTQQYQAEAAKIRAQAQVVRAEGEAKAIQLKAQALRIDPKLIDLEWVQQLNPDQVILLPDGVVPLIQLGQPAAAAPAPAR